MSQSVSNTDNKKFHPTRANNLIIRHNKSLFARISSKDKFAANECVEKYGNKIWALVANLVSELDVENVVRSVFIDVWKNSNRFNDTTHTEEQFIKIIAIRRIMKFKRALN